MLQDKANSMFFNLTQMNFASYLVRGLLVIHRYDQEHLHCKLLLLAPILLCNQCMLDCYKKRKFYNFRKMNFAHSKLMRFLFLFCLKGAVLRPVHVRVFFPIWAKNSFSRGMCNRTVFFPSD